MKFTADLCTDLVQAARVARFWIDLRTQIKLSASLTR